ncbi:MAG: hypothetical protein VYA68_09680, partial [Pseudomonadota bacterium]|nr:hypothetical protein [Pseudomonadota bacterium]
MLGEGKKKSPPSARRCYHAEPDAAGRAPAKRSLAMTADPIAAIPEAEATGDTAALFADIRAT